MSEAQAAGLTDEERAVFDHRYDEARAAGLTMANAMAFAENHVDVGQLRKLVKAGCPPRIIARIVT